MKNNAHPTALTYLSLTIFVLMAVPRFRFMIGSAPIYAIDFLAFLTWFYARRVSTVPRYPLQGFVVFILMEMFVSELVSGLRMGTLLEPTYLIIRTLLAISLFFSTPKIIQNQSNLESIIKAGLLGALISAVLMIMTSLPSTRDFVMKYVFSNSFLEPGEILTVYDYRQGVAGRGRSLIGVSNVSGAFLNTIWPLLLLLGADSKVTRKWRFLLVFAAILIPMAAVMSYSREVILGLLLVVIMAAFFNSSKVRRPIVLAIGLLILIFSWVGWNSKYFYFERITLTIQAALTDPYGNVSLTERLFSYTEPFQHLFKNPEFFFFGQGFARMKVSDNNLSAGSDAATHSVFAAAYYSYGMLAALDYILLLIGGFRITWGYIRRSKNDFSTLFSRAMLASLAGFLSWFMLGHAAVSEPRGAMLLFFVFGLVAAQSNFANSPEFVLPKQTS